MHRWITARGPASRQSAAAGFVLPLAITTSVVLLLGSASLHTLALHGRWRERQQWQSITQRDQLRSAAMMYLDQASDPGQRCVLAWPSSDWSGLAVQCPDADVDRLRQGQLDGESWQLLQWQLTPQGATLTLALVSNGSAAEVRLHRHGEGFRLADGLVSMPSHVAAEGTSALETP